MSCIKRILAVLTVLCMMLTVSSCAAEPTYVDMTIKRGSLSLFMKEGPRKYTIEKLTEQAQVIVLADVNGRIVDNDGYDVAELTVREIWKGDIDSVFSVQEDGNVNIYPYSSFDELHPDDTTCEGTPSGEPLMRCRNRVVLFLEKDDNSSHYGICGGTAGKFFFDKDGAYHNCIMYSKDYEMLQQGEFGDIKTGYLALDEMTPKTKRELKRIVKSAQ